MPRSAAAKRSKGAQQPVMENYYKIAPGRAEEWLALYKKWHLPYLKELQKEGRLLSITIFQPKIHQGSPEWHYKVLLRYADFANFGQEQRNQQILRRLFPNQEELRRNEQRRWEITERHWDDLMVEVPA
jgi:hypothetical protein